MALFRKRAKKPAKDALSKKDADSLKPEKTSKRRMRMPKFLRSIGGYFKGARDELRYVRWPNRRATWGLTVAVITFTALVMLFIVGVDYVFDALFQRLIL